MSAATPGVPPAAGYPTLSHPAPPRAPELPDGVTPTPAGPQWRAWTAWVALISAFVAAGIFGAVIIAVGAALGSPFDDPTAAVNILALVAQDVCLVGAAVVFARMSGRWSPADFGLRPVRLRTGVGWALLAWVSFIGFTAAWVAIFGLHGSSEELPDSLGVDESTLALIAVSVLVCVGAPIVEELFFRGFFFTALRSWRGMWPAAIITGVVFGSIHAGSADAAFLVPLGLFGFALCLLYARTGSLLPCMGAHALNNSLAFGSTQDWDWQIVPLLAGSLLAIWAVMTIVWRVSGRPGAAIRSWG